MATYPVGNLIKCEAEFWVSKGRHGDPTVVVFTLTRPDGTNESHTYPSDPDVLHERVGVFAVTVLANQAGSYSYRFEGQGALQAAEVGEFGAQ